MRILFLPLFRVIVCVGSCRQLSPDNSSSFCPLIVSLIVPRPAREKETSSRNLSSRFPEIVAVNGPAGAKVDGGVFAGTYSAGNRSTRESGGEFFPANVAIKPGGDCAGAASNVVARIGISVSNQQRLSIGLTYHRRPARVETPSDLGIQTTFLVFLAAPARTRIIAANVLSRFLLPRQHLHYLRRRPPMRQQIGHRLHVGIDVPEKFLISRAQIVQPRLAIGRQNKPMLRTLAVARKLHIALAAIFRQRVALIRPKCPLPRRVQHLPHS